MILKNEQILVFSITLSVLMQIGLIMGCTAGSRVVPLEPISEAMIGRGRIFLPLGRIVLTRGDTGYCAIRFTKETKTEYNKYASYESWYQGDGTGDFTRPTAVHTNGDIYWKVPILPIRIWQFLRGYHYPNTKTDIRCGPTTFEWIGRSSINSNCPWTSRGCERIQFAATPWTSISQVNVNDEKIIWYEREELIDARLDIRIPIDLLWSIDLKKERKLQASADNGHQPWRLDFIATAHAAVVAGDPSIKIEHCTPTMYGYTEANVLCKGRKEHMVMLRKLVRQTKDGIWTVLSVTVKE